MSAGELFAGKVRIRVSALIIRDKNIVLVKQQVPTRSYPIWLPPGGGVEQGEYIKQALVREVEEETTLRLQRTELKYIHEFIEQPFHAVEFYFVAEEYTGHLKTGSDPELDADEQQIMQAQWVPVNKVQQLELYPEFLKKELFAGTYSQPDIRHFRT